MAMVIPAPQGATGWGRSFLDFAMGMKTLEERKKARGLETRRLELAERAFEEIQLPESIAGIGLEREKFGLAERKQDYLEELEREKFADLSRYRDALMAQMQMTAEQGERQVELAERKQDYLEELERQYGVTRMSALATKLDIREAKRKVEMIEGMTDEEYKDFATAGEVLKQMRASNITLRDQTQTLQIQMQMADMIRRQQESMLRGIGTEVDAVYSADNLPADLKIEYGRELKQSLMGLSTGQFDPNKMRSPIDIRADIRDAITKERTRVLTADIAEKKRVEEAKTKEIRERAVEWPPEKASERTKYEYGSYQEYDLAMRNRQDPPEVRYVYIDPIGWGIWTREDATKLKIPVAYQGAGHKLMTENRAKALGLHEAWIEAGAGILSPLENSEVELDRLLQETTQQKSGEFREARRF